MKKSKTEITIETNRKFIIRAHRSFVSVWCSTCREARRMVTPEEAHALSCMSLRTIYRAVETGEAHFVETIEGALLVCLKSLGITENNPLPLVISDEAQAVDSLLQLMSHTGQEQASENTHCPPARKRDWVLTAEALDGLLNCLDSDRERAGLRYENTRRRLMKYFECRGCVSAEDLADETINRVARRVSEGKEIWTSDPASYFYGVARNVLKEYWGAPEREFAPVGLLPQLAHPYEDILKQKDLADERLIQEQLLESLDHCMQNLSAQNRELIIKYYQGEKGDKIKNRKDLAQRLGIPSNALRIRVHRIREKLETEVESHLKQMLGRRNGF